MKYVIRDVDDGTIFFIVNADKGLEKTIYKLRDKWYDKEMDCSLIEFLKEELTKRNVQIEYEDGDDLEVINI